MKIRCKRRRQFVNFCEIWINKGDGNLSKVTKLPIVQWSMFIELAGANLVWGYYPQAEWLKSKTFAMLNVRFHNTLTVKTIRIVTWSPINYHQLVCFVSTDWLRWVEFINWRRAEPVVSRSPYFLELFIWQLDLTSRLLYTRAARQLYAAASYIASWGCRTTCLPVREAEV